MVYDNSEVVTKIVGNGSAAVQVLRGAAARAYQRQVHGRSPRRAAAFARAAERLGRMGYKPTDKVVAQRIVRRSVVRSGGIMPVSLKLTPTGQTTEVSDGVVDLIWTSWDTGDNSTWTGVTEASNYEDNLWGTFTGQHDLTSEDTAWRQVFWANYEGGGDGGGPYPIRYDVQPSPDYGRRAAKGGVLAGAPRLLLAAAGGPGAVAYVRPNRWWKGDYRGYYGCSAAWCAGAAIGCALFADGAAPGCFAAGCTGAMIGCSYGTLWE
jgi:hypothetical protein